MSDPLSVPCGLAETETQKSKDAATLLLYIIAVLHCVPILQSGRM